MRYRVDVGIGVEIELNVDATTVEITGDSAGYGRIARNGVGSACAGITEKGDGA